MSKNTKNKIDPSKDFDSQFKTMLKDIISEENYFKQDNIKQLMEDILKEIEPLIAKHVKNHIEEIAKFMLTKIDKEEKDAKTS